MKRLAVVLVASVMAAACTSESAPVAKPEPSPAPTKGESPKPKPSPKKSPKPKPGPDKPVARVSGIKLYKAPQKLRAKCKEIDRATRFQLLCPSVFTQRTKKPRYAPTARALKDGKRFYGIEVGYSAPYGNPKKNRPTAFAHFLVMNGAEQLGGAPMRKWKKLGKRRYGNRRGRLLQARGFSIHHQHYVFVWREGRTPYIASLHRWDKDKQTRALLARLVATLYRPAKKG